MNPKAARSNGQITMYSLFAWLWAMSMIWHYMRPDHGHTVGWADLSVVVVAILVLIRPQNGRFLLATAIAHILVFLITLPAASNHWTMQFFVNTTLFSSFIYLAVNRRSLDIDTDIWLGVFRPVVCLLMLMLYLFTSLHKLNVGYFSEYSFALRLYHDIVHGAHMAAFSHLFPTDASFLAVLPHLSILAELVIPVLLFFRRTRLLAILIGMSFHTLLSLKEYPPGTDFPTLLGAAYVLFLPLSIFDVTNTYVARFRDSRYYQLKNSIIVPAILLAVIFVPNLYSLPRRSSVDWFSFANLKSAHWALYVVIYLALLVLLIYKLGLRANDKSLQILRDVRYPLIFIPVLFVLVGMSPYFGLRSSGAFAMFSNLETEGNYSNHFFIPQDLQIFDYQKQVCVIETTAEDIPTTAKTGALLTWHSFLKLTRRNPNASITYTFEGERFELERIADMQELVAEPDWFERFYLVFQSTNWDKKTTYCDWRW